MIFYGETNKGLKREINEDAFGFEIISENIGFAVVCDGMGGTEGGEIAAQKAVEFISESLKKSLKAGMKNNSIRYILESSVETANSLIYEISQKNENLKGMGTTVVLAVINNNTLHIAHAGDSRAYLLRDNDIHRLTVDHSMVQTLMDHGKLTEDEAKVHPNKNIITRALGVEKHIIADLSEVYLQENDILLLCSDGLTNYVDEKDIQKLLKQDASKAPNKLIQKANKAGGGDNITAVALVV